MRYAIAVDVGVKNLGLCVFDFSTSSFCCWLNVNLVPSGRYQPCKNVEYVENFIERFKHFFDDAAYVVVERQMRCNMRIIEALLEQRFKDRCTIISPRSVKAHYALGMRNYTQNKAAAVTFASQFVSANPDAFDVGVAAVFLGSKKRDDFANALMLMTYFLDTYSVCNDVVVFVQ